VVERLPRPLEDEPVQRVRRLVGRQLVRPAVEREAGVAQATGEGRHREAAPAERPEPARHEQLTAGDHERGDPSALVRVHEERSRPGREPDHSRVPRASAAATGSPSAAAPPSAASAGSCRGIITAATTPATSAATPPTMIAASIDTEAIDPARAAPIG